MFGIPALLCSAKPLAETSLLTNGNKTYSQHTNFNGKQDPHSFANEARELSLVQNNSANDTKRDTVKTDSSLMSEGAKT